jgi:hypothetical protein
LQTAGASGSPKQTGAPSTAQNSSPNLQGVNGNAYDVSLMFQKCAKIGLSRCRHLVWGREPREINAEQNDPHQRRYVNKDPDVSGSHREIG